MCIYYLDTLSSLPKVRVRIYIQLNQAQYNLIQINMERQKQQNNKF